MHLGEGDADGQAEGAERAAHEREAKVALRVDRRGSAHHDEAYRTTATTATHWPLMASDDDLRLPLMASDDRHQLAEGDAPAQEQDGDDGREERGRMM